MTTEYVLDGAKVTSMETFFQELYDTLIPGVQWGRNLDAFDELLYGDFGTPKDGFVLRWAHSTISRSNLGYEETVRQLQKNLERCHPTGRQSMKAASNRAENRVGPTVFDWIVDIIRDHGGGGKQSAYRVQLILE